LFSSPHAFQQKNDIRPDSLIKSNINHTSAVCLPKSSSCFVAYNIIMTKPTRINWVEHVARMADEKHVQSLGREPEDTGVCGTIILEYILQK